MRQEFIRAKTLKDAQNTAPWAAIIAKVTGGYLAFESADDYYTWESQV